jgi:hypothetical protein
LMQTYCSFFSAISGYAKIANWIIHTRS